ncbi:Ig-like domain-containing protein, partial [Conchiformibius steedae]|uniref:Ig-like domain-containing protein n=1 Tax=Conchiformibius steedae TaxID=153493 RepID=UPI0026F0B0DD
INIAESKQTAVTVSGSVQHAKDGDSVVLRIGSAEYRATVAKGEFSTVVDGKTLANHQSISATVDTADPAGNTAQGKAEHAYRVVTTPPTGKVSLDAITGDNVINKAEAQGKITVSGRTEKVADGSEVIISCGCPNCASTVDKTAVVHGGMFSVEFDGSELVADGRHVMIARVNVRDEAGNTVEVSDSQGYTVAIADPAATLTWNKIAADNIINRNEANGKITLSGSIGTLKSGETATVAVKIGSETLNAVVKDGSYSVEADGSKLAQHKQAEAVLTVTDPNGNRAEKSVVQAYQVDTELKQPMIAIDTINQGKTLNQQTSLNTVTVSGSLKYDNDVNPAATRVTVNINGETHDATVTGNRWQTSIAGSKLAQNQGANSITVEAQVTDKAGNSADSSAKADYRVDTLAPSAQIVLDKITGDNVLSHTEAQNSVTVSGKVTGEFKANDALTLTANGKAVQTTVQAD